MRPFLPFCYALFLFFLIHKYLFLFHYSAGFTGITLKKKLIFNLSKIIEHKQSRMTAKQKEISKQTKFIKTLRLAIEWSYIFVRLLLLCQRSKALNCHR